MEYNYLGKTGIKVSEIALGTMNFGKLEKDNVFAILDKAHDLGINLIDTANVYNQSEKILGEWLDRTGNRGDMIINTKVGWPMGDGPNDRGLSRRHIVQQLHSSLDRLQTDYIDIYQPHYYDGHEDINQLVHLFHEFAETNLITAIAAPLFMRSYHMVAWDLLATQQGLNSIGAKLLTTSLLSRGMYDGDTRHIAKDYDIGLITFGALGGGLLTGKYHSSKEYPASGKSMFRDIVESGRIDSLIDRLQELAENYDTTVANLSFAWVISHDFMDSTVIGASNPDQLEDIITAQDLNLSQDTIDELKQLSDKYAIW